MVGCATRSAQFDNLPFLTVTVHTSQRTAVAEAHYVLNCRIRVSSFVENETSVLYTWLKDGQIVQSLSKSNLYNISSVQVSNAGEQYSCQAFMTIPYYDVSGPFSYQEYNKPLFACQK